MDIKKIGKENKIYLLRIIIILIYIISAYTIVSVFPSGYITLQSQPTLTVTPLSASIAKGTPIVVAITASNYQNLYAYQFDMNYNTDVLSFKSISFSNALGDVNAGQAFCVPSSTPQIGPGNVKNIACTRTIPGGLDGTAILANITFNTTAIGASNLALSNAVLVSADMQSISHSIVNSAVSVVRATKTPPRTARK